jgi:hypothetical protein
MALKKLLMPLVALLMLASMGYSMHIVNCTQETANVSAPCGTMTRDGYMSYPTPSNGTYEWLAWIYNYWTNYQYLFDGDWATYAIGNTDASLYVNYTIPSYATGATWTIKYSGPVINTTSIPTDCLLQSPLRIHVRAVYNTAQAYCFNYSSGIETPGALFYGPGMNIYEENITWTRDFPCNGWECPSLAKTMIGLAPLIVASAVIILLIGMAFLGVLTPEVLIMMLATALVLVAFLIVMQGAIA